MPRTVTARAPPLLSRFCAASRIVRSLSVPFGPGRRRCEICATCCLHSLTRVWTGYRLYIVQTFVRCTNRAHPLGRAGEGGALHRVCPGCRALTDLRLDRAAANH